MSEHTQAAEKVAMKAFVAGWFAHARNPKDAPLLVEEAWHAYRLIESAESQDPPTGGVR